MKVLLKAEPSISTADFALDVQSVSSSGLVVLSCRKAPTSISPAVRLGQVEEGKQLRFLLERNGSSVPLEARLLWVELSTEESESALEMIVDVGQESRWQEFCARPAGS